MPARVLDDPLGIACVFSDGRRVRRLLGGVADPQLARDLMSGLAQLVHPHGTVDADGTLGGYLTAARHLVTTLAGRGFTGGAGQLTRAMLVEYWMGVAFKYEACTRRMLRGFDTATGGLDIRVRELTAGNAFNPQPRSQAMDPTGRPSGPGWPAPAGGSPMTRTRRTGRRSAMLGGDTIRGRRDGRGRRDLAAGTDRAGSAGQVAAYLAGTEAGRRRGGAAWATLYPDSDLTVAYLLLFAIYSGIVPDGIAEWACGIWTGRGCHDPVVLRQRPYRPGKRDPAQELGPVAGAMAEPQRPASFLRRARSA